MGKRDTFMCDICDRAFEDKPDAFLVFRSKEAYKLHRSECINPEDFDVCWKCLFNLAVRFYLEKGNSIVDLLEMILNSVMKERDHICKKCGRDIEESMHNNPTALVEFRLDENGKVIPGSWDLCAYCLVKD